MQSQLKTGGRKKGTPNKLTSTAKDSIAQCASMLEQNGRSLYTWVSEDPSNEKAFWVQMYTKLLPLQLSGDADNPLAIALIERKIVK